MTARLLVFGRRGQVAGALAKAAAGFEMIFAGRERLDLAAQAPDIAGLIAAVKPVAVINAAALATILVRGEPGETYLIGGASERTNLQVVEAICELVDEMSPRPGGPPRRELIGFVEDRPGHDLRYAIDAGKLERQLGWRPRMDFEAGLRRTVRWYLDREDWWRPLLQRYAGERLGRAAT